MPVIYPPSKLDVEQIIQLAFDEAEQRLRVDTEAVVTAAGQFLVSIDHTEDSVRLGDGTNFLTSSTVGSDIGLDVFLINSTLPLPTGAATAAKQDVGNASLASIDTKLTAPLSVTGPLTDSQLRATAVPVSAASLPLPAGAATSANQTTELQRLGTLTETAPATDTASSGLNGRLQRIAQRLSSLIDLLPTSLGQKIMASSLAVTIASDQTTLPISAASLPLPTGAATSANQATGNGTLASIDTKTPALISGRQPVNTLNGSLLANIEVGDAVAVTYPSPTTEVYAYKTGGLAGTLVATITITYTNSSKTDVLSVERT